MAVFSRLSIQSKLVVMLLLVSLTSIAVTAWIGFSSASSALTRSAHNHLNGIRAAKTTTLKSMLGSLRDQVIAISDSHITIDGLRDFKEAAKQLETVTLSTNQSSKLDDFYRDEFLPALDANIEGTPVMEQYLPASPVAQFLQYHYIAANIHPVGRKQDLDSAPSDGSPYGKVHEKLHPLFSRAVQIYGFEDIMLVDLESLTILYSYQKTPELGTSLENGPYANTLLAEKVRALRTNRDRDDFMIADFEPFRPSLGQPMGFAVSPVFDGTRMMGMLVLQFPIDKFNAVLTGNYQWQDEGLGATGEAYLVGPDMTMRSQSRFMHENAEAFINDLRSSGLASDHIETIERQQSVICALPVETDSARAALRGMSGIMETSDYRGESVLSSYGPLELDSLRWAVLVEIDRSEAYAPVRAFGRKVLITATATALIVTLLALIFAGVLTRPLRELAESVRKLGIGEAGVQVPVRSQDEFGDLAQAFNKMSGDIKDQRNQLQKQINDNQELLLNILPASAIDQRRQGDEKASREFADVSVLFAEINGLEDLNSKTGESRVLALLGDLIESFDESGERWGIEKVRTIGSSYLAVCGLSVMRPDHTRRIIQFANDMVRALGAFNREHKTSLTLSVGINCGPVVGGVIGRRKFLYDLWGDTVNMAKRMAAGSAHAIRVTGLARERAGDQFTFTPVQQNDENTLSSGSVWELAAS